MSYSSRIERLESELTGLIMYRRDQISKRSRAHACGSTSIYRFHCRNISKVDEAISRLHESLEIARCLTIRWTVTTPVEVA
jgi:hypothetical protein